MVCFVMNAIRSDFFEVSLFDQKKSQGERVWRFEVLRRTAQELVDPHVILAPSHGRERSLRQFESRQHRGHSYAYRPAPPTQFARRCPISSL